MVAGFTLIELLVVTAIIILISTVVLANNNRFGGRVLLQNFTYDVALSIRQAQVYGISVQRFGDSTFSAGFGVHFDTSNTQNYELFADSSGKGTFDPATDAEELVQTTTLQNGYRIADLCATPIAGAESCGITHIDILFKRPEPDAWISASEFSCTQSNAACQQGARIVLSSPRGDTMSVLIEANGQISVR